MPEAARKTEDGSRHDGTWSPTPHPITQGSSNVKINGKNAARYGDRVTTHTKSGTTHSNKTISSGSSSVKINGKKAARKGDSITCGATIFTGSANVNIGG